MYTSVRSGAEPFCEMMNAEHKEGATIQTRSVDNRGGYARPIVWAAIVIACSAAGVVLVYGQASTAVLTITDGPLVDGRQMIRKTIHNQSPVPLTAYIVTAKVIQKAGILDVHKFQLDSVTDGEDKAIPAGGDGVVSPSLAEDPTNFKYRLVTALFSDGSAFGDQAWARLFVLRRRYAVQALASVIADLEVGKKMTGPDLLKQVEASRLKLVGAQKATAANSAMAADRLPHTGRLRELFEETTPELKAANIQAEADQSLTSLTERYYREAAAVLAPTPPGLWTNLPQEERVQRMIDRFTSDQRRVTESKPTLLDDGPLPGAVKP
jgi:hypothetical protein